MQHQVGTEGTPVTALQAAPDPEANTVPIPMRKDPSINKGSRPGVSRVVQGTSQPPIEEMV